MNHFRCNVIRAEWFEKGDELHFEISANRFLHNMVRILVGTLLEIGRGKQKPEWVSELLQSGDRTRAGRTVPAHGLFLLSVEY